MRDSRGSSVGIGIIGFGRRLQELVPLIPELGQRIRVTAVYDRESARVENELNGAHPDARFYSSYQELLADETVDWVMVGSWNSSHAEHVIAAVEAGKDVFCEKPVATTLEDHFRIAEALGRTGRRFLLGFTLRYSPHYRRIKQLLSDDAVGTILSLEFSETLSFNHGGYIMGGWRRYREHAGSHLLEKCCHDFDVINWLLEDRVLRAASFGGRDFFLPENRAIADGIAADADGTLPYRSWLSEDAPDPFETEKDIVDNQVVILQYSGNTRATFHTNLNAGQPERRLYLVGTKGTIRADVLSGSLKVKQVGFGNEEEELATGVSGIHGGGDPVLCEHLRTAMTGGELPLTGLREGLEAAVACLGVDRALQEGSVVDLRETWDYVDGRLAAFGTL